ncbi:MAG: hypothetical protein F4Z37_13245 [Rhodothermaceae bacterium]|nr:hypothetical protein [Rhodothermaceae bacterium]
MLLTVGVKHIRCSYCQL